MGATGRHLAVIQAVSALRARRRYVKGSELKQELLAAANSLMVKMGLAEGKKGKIFAVGFNKSGTTSMHALFTSLGLRSYHGVEWRGCDNMELFAQYDCFSDDIPKDLPRLDRLFPRSKFILQLRELDGWVYSRLAHIKRDQAMGLPGGREWDISEYAITAWIKKRNAHHLYVLNYFSRRPKDLLVINFIRDQDAATRTANFLGYPGSFDKPQENINPNKKIPELYVELLGKSLAALGIPEGEQKYDIYCPSLENPATRAKYPFDSSKL